MPSLGEAGDRVLQVRNVSARLQLWPQLRHVLAGKLLSSSGPGAHHYKSLLRQIAVLTYYLVFAYVEVMCIPHIVKF